jgi:RNA polymerase sigma factor (sigma-70 family)
LPLAKSMAARRAKQHPRHADELYSAAMLGLVQAAGWFKPEGKTSFATYARRVIAFRMINELQSIGIEPASLSFDPPASGPSPDLDEDDTVRGILRQIRARYRLAARLVWIEGLTKAEASRRMGLSHSCVRKYLVAARIQISRHRHILEAAS